MARFNGSFSCGLGIGMIIGIIALLILLVTVFNPKDDRVVDMVIDGFSFRYERDIQIYNTDEEWENLRHEIYNFDERLSEWTPPALPSCEYDDDRPTTGCLRVTNEVFAHSLRLQEADINRTHHCTVDEARWFSAAIGDRYNGIYSDRGMDMIFRVAPGGGAYVQIEFENYFFDCNKLEAVS